MADTKPHPEQQIRDIHAILDQYNGEEALERIRAVLYGGTNGDDEPEEKEVE